MILSSNFSLLLKKTFNYEFFSLSIKLQELESPLQISQRESKDQQWIYFYFETEELRELAHILFRSDREP